MSAPEDLDPPPPQNKALLALVIGLGVLLIAGTILLVVALALGWHKRGDRAPAAAPAGLVPGSSGATLDVTVPKGAALYTLTGDGNRIALQIRGENGIDEVVVIDTARNQVVSRIRLVPEARP
jgi:hypothetical protein